METVELRFSPTGGWSNELDGNSSTSSATSTAAALQSAGPKALSPWVISWEVGIGASVDRGLKLARVQCRGRNGGTGVAEEQFIVGEWTTSLDQSLEL